MKCKFACVTCIMLFLLFYFEALAFEAHVGESEYGGSASEDSDTDSRRVKNNLNSEKSALFSQDNNDVFRYVRELERRLLHAEDQIKHLVGYVEVLEDKLVAVKRRMKVAESRLEDIDGKLISVSKDVVLDKGKGDEVITADVSVNEVYGKEILEYDDCVAKLTNDNKLAADCLKGFISRYPDTELLDVSYYWLGEAYYIDKNYSMASEAYLKSYKARPKGDQAPGAVYKLGLSMKAMGNDKEACNIFMSLLSDFATIPRSIRIRVDREIEILKADGVCS